MREFFRELFGMWGQKEVELAEKLGIRNPHPFTANEYFKDLFMLAPSDIGQEHKYPKQYVVAEDAGLYKLPDTITLHRTKPAIVPDGQKIVAVNLSVNFSYEVPQNMIGRGCCGSYSIRQSVSLGQRYGGDPRCGGGIKRLFPPRKLKRVAEKKLADILKTSTLTGLTLLYEIGGYYADCAYDGSKHNSCNISIDVGDEISIIQNFFKLSDSERHYNYVFTDRTFAKFKDWQSRQPKSSAATIDCSGVEPYGLKISRVNVKIVE